MNFSTAIVTVPKRLAIARTLAKELDGKIILDANKNGPWWGHKTAMLAYSKPYHLILEDDVMLCADFIEGLDKICSLFPEHPVTLFNMSGNIPNLNARAEKKDIHFIGTSGATGQAQLWPVKLIRQFVQWCDANIPETIPYEDTRLWFWLRKTNSSIFLATPNLVEHLFPNESTLGFRGNGRVSGDFLGSFSAASIDWEKNIDLARKTYLAKIDQADFWKEYGYDTGKLQVQGS